MNRSEGAYRIRPVSAADLPMLSKWLQEPHVREWWDEPGDCGPATEIIAAMEDIATEPLIVQLHGRPIAYMQFYAPHLEEGHPYRDQPAGTLGIDQFIGPPDLVGLGHGPRFIRAFVDEKLRGGCPKVIVDPHPANARAIRAYEKAGFVAFDRRRTVFGPALMMARHAAPDDRRG